MQLLLGLFQATFKVDDILAVLVAWQPINQNVSVKYSGMFPTFLVMFVKTVYYMVDVFKVCGVYVEDLERLLFRLIVASSNSEASSKEGHVGTLQFCQKVFVCVCV